MAFWRYETEWLQCMGTYFFNRNIFSRSHLHTAVQMLKTQVQPLKAGTGNSQQRQVLLEAVHELGRKGSKEERRASEVKANLWSFGWPSEMGGRLGLLLLDGDLRY